MISDSETKVSLPTRLVGGPSGLRQLLEKLGPTFIKVGQFLALRPDLVPQEYCDELMKLLDRVEPFSWVEARAILKEDFGRDHSELFAYVNPRPLAAGSLAQAHLARLKDGTEVAVKIQRPNIRERILKDLSRARLIARILDLSGVSLIASPQEVVAELTEWLMQEIDFRRELVNMSRLHALARQDRTQRIPQAYAEFSSARVITAEYLRGVPMTDVLTTLGSGTPQDQERLAALGVERDQLAANLLYAVLTQIFRYQFFHADLHPGNLMALPEGVIGFVDFGLCADLDPVVREQQFRYFAAFYAGDVERMYKALLEILVVGKETDLDVFHVDFLEATGAWKTRREVAKYSVEPQNRSPTGLYLIDVMRAARKNRMQVPARILSLYRALLAAESVATKLKSDRDLRTVGRHFFTSLQIDEAISTIELKNLQPFLLNFFTFLRDSPGQLQQLLYDLSRGRFSLNVEVNEARKDARLSNRRARLISAATASVGIAVLISGAALPAVFGISLRWPLAVVLVFLYIYMLIEWRRLR